MNKEDYQYKWYLFGCKDAGYLHEKKNDAGLTLKEKLLYYFHLSVCKMCRNYVKQLNKMNALLKKFFFEIKPSQNFKNKMKEEIMKRNL